VNGNGYRMGLALILNADINDYSVTNGKFDGFKVLVHSPDEFPNVADRGFVIGPGFETFVGVKVATAYSTDDVGNKVSLKKRKCHVEGQFSIFIL
jgi:acid-sensing ion channel, other